MSTVHVDHSHHGPLQSLKDARRWVRETPAPYWEGEASDKARFLGYVGASMAAWTVVGVLGSVAIGEGLRALAAVIG
jgi:hypothetical protein